MDERYEFEPEEPKKKKRETNWTFLAGMVFGSALTLSCVLLMIGCLRWQMRQSADARVSRAPLLQQGGGEAGQLDLDESAIGSKINAIEQLINQNYLEEADAEQMEEYLYTGLVQGLGDPYSAYFSAQDLELLDESTSGIYMGIGATMNQDLQTGVISVDSCFAGTPAEEAGLLPGDVLVTVNGESISGMDLSVVVAKIKTAGDETVVLGLLRDGEELSVPVTRRRIEVPTVEYEMMEDGIGYLKITEFDDITTSQVDEALQTMEKQGMEKLVVDLRNNPGGVLDVVCDVLDLFLPECRLVYTEDKYGNKSEFYANDDRQFEKPLAVLVNQDSASASEIFAGAVRDYGIGTLVGTTTFGKGIVQRIFNLTDGSGVKLTIAKYYTPNGQYIHEKGIEPDVEVELDEEQQGKNEIPRADDNQLQKAIAVLQGTDG